MNSYSRLEVSVQRLYSALQLGQRHANETTHSESPHRILVIARLLFASVDFLPQIGGVSLATHHIANAFVRAGHEVTILAPAAQSDLSEYEIGYEQLPDENASPRTREGTKWAHQELPRLLDLVRRVWREREFDRAVAMHPFYYGPPLQLIADEFQKPFSVMFHGFELRSQLLWSERVRSFRAWVHGNGPTLRQSSLVLARKADQIITNSTFTMREVKRTKTKAPILVSGCGIDKHDSERQIRMPSIKATAIRERTRAELGLHNDEFTVGSLGRLVPHKNFNVLIEAIAQTKKTKAVIIGDGPERSALVQLTESRGLQNRIIFKHGESEQRKWELLRALDAFALLTGEGPQGQVEGFGIVILEASAAGVPVIVSNSGGITDVVKDGVSGIMTKVGESTSVAKAIMRLNNDPTIGAGLVLNAQRKIETDFNWSAIARKLARSWELDNTGADVKSHEV